MAGSNGMILSIISPLSGAVFDINFPGMVRDGESFMALQTSITNCLEGRNHLAVINSEAEGNYAILPAKMLSEAIICIRPMEVKTVNGS